MANLSGVITSSLLHTGLKHINCKAHLHMRPHHCHRTKHCPVHLFFKHLSALSCKGNGCFLSCSFRSPNTFLMSEMMAVMKRYGAAGLPSSHYIVFIVENIINVKEVMTILYLPWNDNQCSNSWLVFFFFYMSFFSRMCRSVFLNSISDSIWDVTFQNPPGLIICSESFFF